MRDVNQCSRRIGAGLLPRGSCHDGRWRNLDETRRALGRLGQRRWYSRAMAGAGACFRMSNLFGSPATARSRRRISSGGPAIWLDTSREDRRPASFRRMCRGRVTPARGSDVARAAAAGANRAAARPCRHPEAAPARIRQADPPAAPRPEPPLSPPCGRAASAWPAEFCPPETATRPSPPIIPARPAWRSARCRAGGLLCEAPSAGRRRAGASG